MDKYKVKINYLYNSGFTVETEKHLLIFDYFLDSVENGEKCRENGAIGEAEIKTEKNIIVFASHSHGDHFNPVILTWAEARPDINYVLSSDISLEQRNEKIKTISAYEELKVGEVSVKAYGSTDIGISLLIKVDGMDIFHAGDLNWWYWWDDTEEEIKRAESWFKDEIEKIKGEEIDIAFFPVDPRLEHNYSVGGEYFIEKLKPDIFIPMHFGIDYSATERFADKMKGYDAKIIEITHRGQEILL